MRLPSGAYQPRVVLDLAGVQVRRGAALRVQTHSKKASNHQCIMGQLRRFVVLQEKCHFCIARETRHY